MIIINKIMRKTILSLSLLIISSFCFAQEKCATMLVLEKMLEKDSTLYERIIESERLNKEWMDNKLKRNTTFFIFPKIPDFEPTGDNELDFQNFLNAKQMLINKDPERYKVAIINREKELKAKRKEMLEKHNNTPDK